MTPKQRLCLKMAESGHLMIGAEGPVLVRGLCTRKVKSFTIRVLRSCEERGWIELTPGDRVKLTEGGRYAHDDAIAEERRRQAERTRIQLHAYEFRRNLA